MRKIVIGLVVLAAVASSAAAQTYKADAVRSLVLAAGGNDPTKALTLKVPAMPLGSITLTLPNQNASGVLLNDGTGTLSWFNIGGLLTNPMTSPGDMIYGGLLGAPSRLAATSTANQILLSGANAAPSWSTATYPATSGIAGNYLRSDGTNFVSSGIQAGDVPTLNQNTTGSAAKLTTARTIAGNSFDGSANTTFANKFIVQGTSDAGLTGAQFLGSLATGLVKNTTTTGVLSTATAGTDYSAGTSALATGILKSTTATGALSIAVAADFPTLNQNTTGTAATATNVATTLQTASASTFYPTFVPSNTTSTGQAANVATGLSYVPSTGTLSATTFSGAFSGNATGFTGSLAGDVTGTQGATAINTTSAAGGHIISALTANASTLTNNTTGSAAKLTTPRTIAGTSFDGSANIALANKFIVQGTSDAGLTGAQFLGSLATGLVKNTTTTGVLSTATAGTDYSAGTSALATGILKSTTATGALSIAVPADFPTLNQNTTGTASNVTGVVALANGGTGVTNASGVAQNAIFAGPSSGGAGAASWRALAASDLPSGSGHYIQDETAQQTGASFNVDGSGAVGTTFTAGASVTSPTLYGGSAAGSTLNLASTSNASPSGDYVTVTTGGAERARFNSAGQLGVATNAPNTTLDVNGDFAMRVSGNSTATTTFDSLPTTGTSVIDITGATGNFTIASIGQGYNGKHLTIYNRTAHTMTIKNENATSTAANRIKTLSGADVSITSNSSDGAVAEFIYDTNTTRWIYESSAGNTISGLSAVGINYTVVAANEEFNSSGVSDPYITFYGLAGATYEVRGILIVKDSNNSNGDAINIGFATASSSSTMEVTVWGASGVPTGNTQFQGSSIIESDGTGGEVSVPAYKASNGAETFYNVTGVIKPAASGQVHLVWKTVGNGVGAGVLKANSYIAFTRVN
jgi:hypothetical protein